MYLHGIEQLEKADRFLRGKRIGLVTNYTALDRGMRRSVDLLHERYGLSALFSPEHGLFGVAQAGMSVGDETDRKTGLPIRSLYGSNGKKEEMFEGLDVVAFDIQDVGVRFYTYTSVLAECMKICKTKNIGFVVFDRYNPLGLTRREGTVLDERFSSYVGMYAIPSRHGLTVGEYARYINGQKGIGCDLAVIPCGGLSRADDFRSVGVPWVFPSPNMPSYETALVYAGTVVFEGTNISEGRGTTRPFQLIGAPWIDGDRLCQTMNAFGFPGVICRSADFIPTFSKFKGELCHGIEILPTDPEAFRPCEYGLTLWHLLRETYPEYYTERDFLTSLFGTDVYRDGQFRVEQFLAAEQKKIEIFNAEVKPYLLYK